ncbi:MFS transporter [Streptomyces decoyicus]|uniref:MFS transporter n=1 Tax=Streptomyces decoyicus TaxID=249567 RepID=UPI00365982D6
MMPENEGTVTMTTSLDLSTSSYRRLLARPHVLRLLASAIVGHLPVAMTPLALLLAVRTDGGTVSLAGLLAAVYGVSAALGQPWWGRALDRHGHTPTLLFTGLTSAMAFLMLACLPTAQHPAVAGALTTAAGLATPPLEAALRVLWPEVTASRAQLRAALSLDASAQEVVFIVGPLLVLGTGIALGAGAALGVAALLVLSGTLVFTTAAPAQSWSPAAQRPTDRLGPLRVRGPRVLALALAGAGTALGALNVLALDLAETLGAQALSTLIPAALAVGSLAGGLLFGGIRLPGSARQQLAVSALGLAVGLTPFLLAPGPIASLITAVLPGFFLAPLLITVFALLEDLVPDGTLGEASAWMIAALGLGQAAGTAIAGAVGQAGPFLPATVAFAGALLAVVSLLLGRRALAEAAGPAAESAGPVLSAFS